jgi:diamine N-acetyltransferase
VTAPSIRRATPADAAALTALAIRTFRETFERDNRPEDFALYLAQAYGPAQQAAELAHPRIVTLVAEAGGVLAGYAQLRVGVAEQRVEATSPVQLWRFYVDRPWQGRGLAQSLMAAVEREARAAGADVLWLGVWERNARAQAFYRTCGFVDVGTQSFLVGTDLQTDRVMARRLDDRPG